jgi:hypothetical protein
MVFDKLLFQNRIHRGICLALVCCIFMFVSFILDQRQWQQFFVNRHTEKFLLKKIAKYQDTITARKNLLWQQEKLEREILHQQPRMLQPLSITELLNNFIAVANKVGVTIVTLTPQKQQDDKGFNSLTLQLTIAGSYQRILRLIKTLEAQKGLIVFKQVSLQVLSNNLIAADEVTLTALINVINCTDKISTMTAHSTLIFPVIAYSHGLGKRNPFAESSSSKKNDNEDLANWSMGQLKFLGMIWHENIVWGIVIDPSGEVYHVRVGEKLGREGAVIANITTDKLVTTKPQLIIIRDG